MKKPYCRHIVLAAILLMLGRCSQNPVQSTTGGGGTKTVYGMVRDTEGNAVADAGVYLYSRREVPTGEDAVDSAVTNTSGEFRFVDVASGTYQIDVVSPGANLRGLISDVVVDKAPVVLPADTIREAATLTGWVEPQESLGSIIGIAGSPYRAAVDAGGRYTFSGLPEGAHTLVAMVYNPTRPNDPVIVGTLGITVSRGEHARADSIRHMPLGPPPDPLVLDDFDDCNDSNALGGSWWTYHDAELGGTSTVVPAGEGQMAVAPGRQGAGCALGVTYSFGATTESWYPRAGMGCNFGGFSAVARAVDFSAVRRVTFWAKGSTPNFYISLVSALEPGVQAEARFDGLSDTAWKQYAVDLSSDIVGEKPEKLSWNLVRRFITRITARALDMNARGASGEILLDDIEIHFN